MIRVASRWGVLIPLGVLAAALSLGIAVPIQHGDQRATVLAQDLEALGAADAKVKDDAKRRILRAGPAEVRRLRALRDELSEILDKHEDLNSSERNKAVAAVRYFAKRGAAEYVALALLHSNDDVALAAVASISELNAKQVLPQVLDSLEHNNFSKEGSEEATIHNEVLVPSLLRLVNKLSEKNYNPGPPESKAISFILKDARKK